MGNTNTLEHFGILGMKWGRKSGRSQSSPTNPSPQTRSEDFTRSRVLKKKKMSEMSNAELRELTTRLQLEKQYKDLKKAEISKGRKFVDELMANIAKDAVSRIVKKGTNTLVKKIVK